MGNLLDELLSSYGSLAPEDRAEFKQTVMEGTASYPWIPNPGPQTVAYESEADELFYGGAAGGGKTDLICGLALLDHTRTLVLRREGTDLRGIEQRMTDVMGGTDGYNQQRREWKLGNDKVMELGSCQHEKDKFGYQGRPHDLKAFDEITQFLRSQYMYVIGWNRSTKEGQRCRVVCAGNPPSTPEGQWVKVEWGPWLDKTFPSGYRCIDADGNPCEPPRAGPGELRWYTTDETTGDTVWVDKDWRGVDSDGNEIQPKSRTFVPAMLGDNPFLGSDYRARVAAMPEPLRSQLLYGDFNVAERDQINQVLPTAWVRAACARWTTDGALKPMIAMGVDVAQGGDDKTVLAPRYLGDYIGELVAVRGSETPDGPTGAALITTHVRHGASINIDMGGGFGQSTHDHLKANKANVWKFVPAGAATKGSKSGLKYYNLRAQSYWELRELLDPASERKIALPPDEEMVADLCAPTWWLTPRGIQMEDKADIRKRIGRSPDKGDAIVIAFMKPYDDFEAELSLPEHLGKHRKHVAKRAAPDVMDTV